jgi:ribosomal 50S subunit-recycling heat shock protein
MKHKPLIQVGDRVTITLPGKSGVFVVKELSEDRRTARIAPGLHGRRDALIATHNLKREG